MPGTRIGGQRAAEKNRKLYGDDFYARIGARGGSATVPKGFAKNRDLARAAGAAGGKKSRRGKAKVVELPVVDSTTTQDDVQLAA